MPSPQIERKLAAIMFTDIAGYTAQMSKDEAVAISLLNKKESVLKPLIAKHNGTYVKSTGDGSLSHFNSAVDAATCAKRLQESIYDDKDLNVRVGVHLGDTIFEKGDIRGDGVNIASRLNEFSPIGGIVLSKNVSDNVPIESTNPVFRVIQTGDTREYSLGTNNLYQFSLNLIEAQP